MEFRVLGSLEVTCGGAAVEVTGPKRRALLILLLLAANEVVSTDRIIDALWGHDGTGREEGTLRVHIVNLRKALEPDRPKAAQPTVLVTRGSGYMLRVDSDAVDIAVFERLALEGHQALNVDISHAADQLSAALALWRGPALQDVAYESFAQPEIRRLEELRVGAVEDRLEAKLGMGEHAGLVAELEGLVRDHPLRERFHQLLMVALYRSDRQADALRAFGRAKTILASELGIDPSLSLRRLEEQILAQDPELDAPTGGVRHPAPSGPPEPGRAVRGYELRDRIGAGQFGEVFRAYQPSVGREVAIKVLRPEHAGNPEFVRSFQNEARVVARLEHPHIVPLYDYWREPSHAYLVMRWLRGGSLSAALERGPWNPGTVARSITQVCDALSTAHEQGVVHRDLKPANILFDENDNAYVGDFGIAVGAIDQPGGIAGTQSTLRPPYASPEVLRREPATRQSDIYSLGIVAFEMLTARKPFNELAVEELSQSGGHLPSVAPDGYGAAVDEVLSVATAANPTDRYPSTDTFAERLVEALGIERSSSKPPAVRRNPYKGLEAFQQTDAADFYGRDRIVERLVSRVGAAPLVAVVGPSGSGKSSLVRAGLLPALRQGALAGSDRWPAIQMKPGLDPFEEFTIALKPVALSTPSERADEQGLVRAVQQAMLDTTDVVVVIDQLEELFTHTSPELRDRFVVGLTQLAALQRPRIHIVATIRADFYDHPLRFRALGELIAANTIAVPPLSPEELERVIVGPASRAGVALEPGLVAEMINEVADQPGGLPLLQYALTELFEQRRRDTITVSAYRRIGGVVGALSSRADDVYRSLDDAQEAIRQVFLRLVTVGDGPLVTRRRVLITELKQLEGEGTNVDAVIHAYCAHRMLTLDRDPMSRTPTVEIAHEALFSDWNRLSGWIDDARQDVLAHRRLADSARQWTELNKTSEFLLSEGPLAQVEHLATGETIALTATERRFLEASIEARDDAVVAEHDRQRREVGLERRSSRRLRILVGVLAVAAVVATALTAFAVNQRGDARDQAAAAARQARIATARELSAASTINLDTDPERSVLLALEAIATTQDGDGDVLPEASNALRVSLSAMRVLHTLAPRGRGEFNAAGTILATGGDETVAVGPNPDGGSLPGIARLWDVETGEIIATFEGHTARVYDVEWSPDESRLLTAGWDGTIGVWDVATTERLLTIEHTGGAILEATYNPSGTIIAAGNFARPNETAGIKLWDAGSGEELVFLSEDAEGLVGVAFSPDGQVIVAAGGAEPTVWDVATARPITRLTGDRPSSTDVTFSPDGRLLALSTAKGTVELWDTRSWNLVRTIAGLGPIAWGADFTADSSTIAVGGSDGTAALFDVASGNRLLTLAGHSEAVYNATFSPDGRLVATDSDDGTNKIWDVTPTGGAGELAIVAHDAASSYAIYNPDGETVATAGFDGWARIWNVASAANMLELTHDGDLMWHVAYSHDGARIATAGEDGTARIHDVDSGDVLATVVADGPIRRVAFDPSGDRLLVVSGESVFVADSRSGRRLFDLASTGAHRGAFSPDGRFAVITYGLIPGGDVPVFDADTGRLMFVIGEPHDERVQSLSFKPDGSLLATAGEDGTTKLWRMGDNGTELELTLLGHQATVSDVAFSPDGRLLATASWDSTARLWDAETGEELAVINLGSSANSVVFNPAGSHILVSLENGQVREFPVALDDVVKAAYARLTRWWTPEECERYLHATTCPLRPTAE